MPSVNYYLKKFKLSYKNFKQHKSKYLSIPLTSQVTRDGVRHSRPFFTRAVTSLELGDPGNLPWQLPVTRAILRHWAASDTFQASYLESLLHDLLHPEVTALSSVHLAVSRISGEGGECGSDNDDGQNLSTNAPLFCCLQTENSSLGCIEAS